MCYTHVTAALELTGATATWSQEGGRLYLWACRPTHEFLDSLRARPGCQSTVPLQPCGQWRGLLRSRLFCVPKLFDLP
jgi:hypothetical protein